MKSSKQRVKKGIELQDDMNEILYENRLDPRQKLMWSYYMDQTKPTFSNATKSGIAAGYSPMYSRIITTMQWFKTKRRRSHLLTKSEKIMNKILDIETEKADVMRVQADVSKHITKTLGKDEGYTEKSEVVGGSNIVFLPQELINKFNLAAPETVKPEDK